MTREEFRAICAEDRVRLLRRYRRWARRNPRCPADAVPGILSMLGYQLGRERLPGHTWALIYPNSRRVVLNEAPELRYPADPQLVQSFSLCHELAHSRGILQERAADVYAGVFLVPKRALVNTQQAKLLRSGLSERYLWRLVYELARQFQVSATAMAVQMDALGLLRFLRKEDGKGILVVE